MQDRFKLKFWDNTDKELGEVINIDFDNGFVDYKTKDGITSTQLKCGELIQCIGLEDKNKKLIYENDIVQRNGELLIVRHQKELACFAPQYFHIENDKIVHCGREWFEEYTSKDYELYVANCYEVIGNIYENKDLLAKGTTNET